MPQRSKGAFPIGEIVRRLPSPTRAMGLRVYDVLVCNLIFGMVPSRQHGKFEVRPRLPALGSRGLDLCGWRRLPIRLSEFCQTTRRFETAFTIDFILPGQWSIGWQSSFHFFHCANPDWELSCVRFLCSRPITETVFQLRFDCFHCGWVLIAIIAL